MTITATGAMPVIIEIPGGAAREEAQALINAAVERLRADRRGGKSLLLAEAAQVLPRPDTSADCMAAGEGYSPRCKGCKKEWWGRGRLCDRCKPPRFNPRGVR